MQNSAEDLQEDLLPTPTEAALLSFFTKLCRPYSLKLEYLHSYKHPHHGVLDLHAVMEFPMQRSWPAAV